MPYPIPCHPITYSPAYTLVPTYECFNRCSYCNFRVDLGQGSQLSLAEAAGILDSLENQNIIEILILSGEVQLHSPQRAPWFERIYQLCELALARGFLPHTNVGPLKLEEMARLKQVNVSMGLMLEQMTPKLLETVHRHAPSKSPEIRLQQLIWAGELRIPFTTGLLLGIGETENDWQETLTTIAAVHQRWGHIQEVILQPHSPGQRQVWQGQGFDLNQLPQVVAIARSLLPEAITLQIPPNLISNPEILLACLNAGARDLGGIGPWDEVNPDYTHSDNLTLQAYLKAHGWGLMPRLPVYPQYDHWLPEHLYNLVHQGREKLEQ
ncbi:MAG: 7,8-didemethyl-8-hydroxy-5-deazariboflavin synthase subunit CofG [Microcoleaceae cyanobacterium]